MPVSDPDVIDLVAHDPKTDTVLLVMVEVRPWGTRGELLPELQAKIAAYLTFALDGGLQENYPHLVGKPIVFELSSAEPPGQRERDFLTLVQSQYLASDSIGWREALVPPT